MDAQRHAEYYGMQQTFDELYAKSKAGEVFNGLMELVLSPDNIMLAYRNIKTNTGSYTAGTDKQNIGDIGRLPPAEVIGKVRKIVTGSEHGYRPKPVRRKDIPKPNGKTRPLGIPCIWDRLVQQCIKQILEPICEAKFSNNSYGFRPNRSVEHAISRTYSLLQRAHLHYVLEFDIKGFFDNVNHSKLIKQLWTLGIQDKQLLFVLKRILKAPIRMPDGSTVYPTKGTPQGGIISPLLANVVLNELDHWVDSQWVEHPVANRYGTHRIIRTSEVFDTSKGYQKMRETNLKEMFIVRYADDFRIFCRNREDAEKTMEAVTKWITERLKLEVSPEKTRIVNVRKRYSEFLGFKIMVYRKGEKYVVKSHICDKKLQLEESKLVEQAKRIAKPAHGRTQPDEIGLFDEMVLGIQNYYRIATCISLDCRKIHRRVMTVLTNRLNTESGCQLVREGGAMTDSEKEHYGASQMVRYVSGINRPIYPIAFIKYKTAIGISGIMGNLEGLFDTVNAKVGEIAVQVGTTPAAWNAGVFSLIRQLSETVILPIAGLVLTFVATYELIQMLLEKNNMHEFDVANIYKWVFKTACAILILSNTFNIVMAVFDVSQSVIADAAGLIQGSTDITPDMLAELETTLEGMDLGPLLGLWLQSSVIGLTMQIMGIIIFVLVYGRMIEIYLMTSLAPLPVATLSNRELGGTGQNYLKSLFAIGFQGMLILVCVAIYAVLIQGIATGGDPIGAIWGTVGYTVLLCFMLFKTGGIAQRIFGAH